MIHALNINYPGGFEQLSIDVAKSSYRQQVFFYDALGLKIQADANADDKLRGYINLSAALHATARSLFQVRDAMMVLTAIEEQFPRTHASIKGYEKDFDPIAKELGDLRYDRLAEFLESVCRDTHAVYVEIQRNQASFREIEILASATNALMTAKTQADVAWVISEPKMKTDGSC